MKLRNYELKDELFMSNKVQQFWNEFCLTNNKKGIEYKEAFQFGSSADWLASLVVEGKKTATTSGFLFYELENEDLPKVGDFSIVLDAQEEPVAVIQILSVEVVPMNEVTEEFALSEGEGDFQFWWEAHEKVFTEELKEYDIEFSPDILVVCELFKNVYSKKGVK
jgi:uncharacterized protein YhfF